MSLNSNSFFLSSHGNFNNDESSLLKFNNENLIIIINIIIIDDNIDVENIQIQKVYRFRLSGLCYQVIACAF